MKKITKKFISILFIIIFVFGFSFLYNLQNIQAAEEEVTNTTASNLTGAKTIMETAGKNIGYKTDSNETTFIGNMIKTALSLIGIFFLILVISGGYQWMSAGGNEEIIGKAKKRIINATIGLIIVLMAYAISYFIIDILVEQSIYRTPPIKEAS